MEHHQLEATQEQIRRAISAQRHWLVVGAPLVHFVFIGMLFSPLNYTIIVAVIFCTLRDLLEECQWKNCKEIFTEAFC
jgi:hypothetical protein